MTWWQANITIVVSTACLYELIAKINGAIALVATLKYKVRRNDDV